MPGRINNQHRNFFIIDGINKPVFYRINRKFLVNMDSISKMVAYSRGRVKLELKPKPENDFDTIVSIERSSDFKRWLNS